MASIIFKIPPRYGKRRGPRHAEHDAYKKRDKVLFRIGFASYRDYLRSQLWKVLRAAKLAVDPKCELCGDKAQHVHHLDYTQATLQGRHQYKLASLCERCHHGIEFRADGSKRNFEAAYKTARKRLRQVGRWTEHTRKGAKT